MVCYPSSYLSRIANDIEILIHQNQEAIDRFKKQIRVFNQECLRYFEALKKEPVFTAPSGRPFSLLPNPLCGEGTDKFSFYYTVLAVVFDYIKVATAPIRLCEGILDSEALKIMLDLLADPLGPVLTEDHLDTALRWVKADLESCGKPAETEQKAKRIIAAIVISLIVIVLFELLVYRVPIGWLKNHPNSYGLQGGIVLLILSSIFALFKPAWRKWYWKTALLALVVLILSLLGGRSSR